MSGENISGDEHLINAGADLPPTDVELAARYVRRRAGAHADEVLAALGLLEAS